jgi:hypothetical protein
LGGAGAGGFAVAVEELVLRREGGEKVRERWGRGEGREREKQDLNGRHESVQNFLSDKSALSSSSSTFEFIHCTVPSNNTVP